MASDGLKRVSEWPSYRRKMDQYRLETVEADSAVDAALRGLRDARLSGESEEIAGALGGAENALDGKLSVLGAQLDDPELQDGDRARIEADVDRARNEADRIRSAGGSVGVPPELESAYLQEHGDLQRAGIAGDAGSAEAIRAELMATLGQMIQELGRQFVSAATAPGASAAEQSAIQVEYERKLQPLLTEEAQIEHAADRSAIERVPELTVGGEPFSERYLPSAAEAQSELERIGFGPAQGGSIGAVGAPVPVRLVGGEITVVVNFPGVGKLVSKAPVRGVQKGSEAAGLGTHYPGM